MPPSPENAPPDEFVHLIMSITAPIAPRALDDALEAYLNATFPPGAAVFDRLQMLCLEGIRAGWLCSRQAGGIRFGRPLKAAPQTHGFSVDVVEMNNLAGPYHSHPNGEIDMIIPLDGDARFDGSPAGWKVYGPGSAHRPTVSGGRAVILYLLPDGAIDFSHD